MLLDSLRSFVNENPGYYRVHCRNKHCKGFCVACNLASLYLGEFMSGLKAFGNGRMSHLLCTEFCNGLSSLSPPIRRAALTVVCVRRPDLDCVSQQFRGWGEGKENARETLLVLLFTPNRPGGTRPSGLLCPPW